MDNARFSIIAAGRNAYLFAAREWEHLLKLSLAPLALQIAAGLFVHFYRPTAGELESYLWNLPATIFLAWFAFCETRLILLGERTERLPADTLYLLDRRHALVLLMLMGVLFNMGMALARIVMVAMGEAADSAAEALPANTLGTMFLAIAILWGLRFGIAPILAAVHHPVRPVLKQTWGFLFSLRLAGIGVISTVPVWIIFYMVISAYIMASHPGVPVAQIRLSSAETVLFIVLSAVQSVITLALVTACTVFALRQILGTRKNGTRGGTLA